MAEFLPAFRFMMENERDGDIGYANDPDDSGGETWNGISRRNWPGWKGWDIVDRIKKEVGIGRHALNDALNKSEELEILVEQFYRKVFWMPKYNEIEDQKIATYIFDKSVNMGWVAIHKIVQRCIGVIVDGIVGQKTVDAINRKNPIALLHNIRDGVINHYEDIIKAHPEKKVFRKTWLARANRGVV